ncbi:MAG TPA: hypothetical protein ENF37_00060 [Beggiatoa sp.]|nr:hypothetical protein [Beggiatoa sp.]
MKSIKLQILLPACPPSSTDISILINGHGGQTGGEIWVHIEIIAARLPTLQIANLIACLPTILNSIQLQIFALFFRVCPFFYFFSN